MPLFALGLNHDTAPIAVREKLAFAPTELSAAVADLAGHAEVSEAAIISTCNRTELYCASRDGSTLISWLAEARHIPPADIAPYLYQLPGREAARHAFRVASGLDSMVLGETQILGQIKDAVRDAEAAGGLGVTLNGLFQRAFSVAKEVRSQTAIGANSVSMAAAAVRLAERIFPDWHKLNVLFIGAGEMIELCATHIAAQKPKRMSVANRTAERSAALAERIGGDTFPLGDVPQHLADYDVVVTCTASQLPILGKGAVERAIKIRRHRHIFMVDLAVPRDVEPEVAELQDVYLYSVDDLANVVKQGREERRQAVGEAEQIIERHTDAFMHWLDSRSLVPTIRSLKDHAERIRRHELERAHKLLAKGEAPERVLEAFSQALANKFLHAPLSALGQAEAARQPLLIDTVRQLYHLPDQE